MKILEINSHFTPLRRSIIRALAYYDVFFYPLTADEIYYNLGDNHTSTEQIKKELEYLASINVVYHIGEFYQLNQNEQYIKRRKSGNEIAEKRLKTARRVSKIIAQFPFVRAILLSGSISKGFMEEDSDIDYFVITQPNRVWLSRLLLMLFKKLFLLNSKKFFCINYFVDSEHLEIEEKNIFTAAEIVTLLPTFGKQLYDQFYEKNGWTKEYFPNFPKRDTNGIKETKNGIIKTTIEKVLGNKLGDKIDDFAMHLIQNFNKRKYKHYNTEEFKLAFKSSKKESKHHPRFFQKRVLEEFNRKIQTLEDKYKISLRTGIKV